MQKVFVSPDAPLGLPEFAALYADPNAASNIHLNFPMEAKSLLDKRWKQLGINEAPERYFARGANPAPVSTIPDRNPTFANEAERNMAIASGAYDPAFPSPMARVNYTALKAIEGQDRARIRAEADRLTPIGLNPSLQSQSAGDTTGLVRKFQINQMGLTPEEYYASTDPNALEKDPRVKPLAAYQPRTGFGQMNGGSTPTRLDMDIMSDPDFQRALGEDPEGAAYAYKRLTGRPLKGDFDEVLASRKTQLDTGQKYAIDALKRGAFRDPVTGKWKVWNMAEPEEGIGLSATRPSQAFIEASGPQAKWLDTHYESIMGEKLPQQTREDARLRQDVGRVMEGVPEFEAQAIEDEKTLGRSLTNAERNILAKRLLKQKGEPDYSDEAVKWGTEGVLRGAMLPMDKRALGPLAIPSDQDVLNMLKALIPNLPTGVPEI